MKLKLISLYRQKDARCSQGKEEDHTDSSKTNLRHGLEAGECRKEAHMWTLCTWLLLIAFGAAIALVADSEIERERRK